MIKVFNNFLPKDLTDVVLNYVGHHSRSNVWGVSNLTYHPNLIGSSAPIFSMQFTETIFKQIKDVYQKKFKEFKNKQFLIEYKLYSPMSYITWHGDDGYLAGSTIYLNRQYYENDGGLFLYKEKNNVIKGIEPKFRSMVLNYKDKNQHAVSMVVPSPKFLRETLQVFIKEENNG